MKPVLTGLCALSLWTAAVLPASAAWDNVFQPTLFGRLRQPTSVSQYYVAPVVVQSSPVVVAQASPCDTCQPPPQQQCSTSYTQRCYYQPVVTYQNKTVYDQVTTYRTSYYYEPVTSYRYSCYYDACSCSYQQVAVPTTSYQLRAQNCPVQSWVSRCVQEPVTVQQKVCYWQPQTTCCSTTMGTPIPIGSGPPQVNVAPSMTPISQEPGKPDVSITRTPSTGSSAPKQNLLDQMYYPPLEKAPEIKITPGTSWQPQLGAPIPAKPNAPQPPVKLDRITVGPNSHVDGQVARSDNSPKPNAKVLFVNAGNGQRQTVYANTAGRFRIDLSAGSWHIYVHGSDDIPIHYTRIDVNAAQSRQVNLVSRSN